MLRPKCIEELRGQATPGCGHDNRFTLLVSAFCLTISNYNLITCNIRLDGDL